MANKLYKTYIKIPHLGFYIILASLILAAPIAHSIVRYGPAASLGQEDVTTTHIKNATILGEDINQSTSATTTYFGVFGLTATGTIQAASSTIGTLNVGAVRATGTSYFIGAVTINGPNATDLTVGELSVNSTATFNGNVTIIGTCTGCGGAGLVATSTAGDEILRGDALFISSSTATSTLVDTGSNTGTLNVCSALSERYNAQSFKEADTTVIHRISAFVAKTGTPDGDFVVEIRFDNNNAPSNTVAASSIRAQTDITTTLTEYTFVLNRAVRVPPGARVWVVFRKTTNTCSTTDLYTIGSQANTYANGDRAAFDGTSWTIDNSRDIDVALYRNFYAGSAYLADGDIVRDSNSFVGIANINASSTDNVDIVVSGQINLPNITAGEFYYLATTTGFISKSPGTQNRFVGKGIGTNRLILVPK
jgi:hypothetical protein